MVLSLLIVFFELFFAFLGRICVLCCRFRGVEGSQYSPAGNLAQCPDSEASGGLSEEGHRPVHQIGSAAMPAVLLLGLFASQPVSTANDTRTR